MCLQCQCVQIMLPYSFIGHTAMFIRSQKIYLSHFGSLLVKKYDSGDSVNKILMVASMIDKRLKLRKKIMDDPG